MEDSRIASLLELSNSLLAPQERMYLSTRASSFARVSMVFVSSPIAGMAKIIVAKIIAKIVTDAIDFISTPFSKFVLYNFEYGC
jgi:hypothetical protein